VATAGFFGSTTIEVASMTSLISTLQVLRYYLSKCSGNYLDFEPLRVVYSGSLGRSGTQVLPGIRGSDAQHWPALIIDNGLSLWLAILGIQTP
jgi:hypothetical protein